MKKTICLVILSLLFPYSVTFAAADPELKECIQRGYETEYSQDGNTSYCVLPDKSKCVLEDFNNGTCGTQYKNEDYCVAEGGLVWDTNKCCADTEAYLLPYHLGQTSCVKISMIEKVYNQIKYNPLVWLYGGGIIFIFMIFFIILKIKRRKNSNF